MDKNKIQIPLCSNCNTALFKIVNNKIKIRTNIVLINMDNEKTTILCPDCKTENEIPIKLIENSHKKENKKIKLFVKK